MSDTAGLKTRLVLIDQKLDRVLELLEKKKKAAPRRPVVYSPLFEKMWALYPKRAGSNPKKAAWYALRQRLSEKLSPEDILEGVKRYRRFCDATGKTNTEMVMQASRFFGPGYEFENDWAIPQEARAPRTNEDWMALGRKMGMEPKSGESWSEFKDRLKGAM